MYQTRPRLRSAIAILKDSCYALFGLQHNWLNGNIAEVSINKISDSSVPLGGEIKQARLWLKPNVNDVAARLAAAAIRNGLKTIVFVNVKSHAVSTAKKISNEVQAEIHATPEEELRWAALEEELGNLKHSILSGPMIAVPHNAEMLRLERDLAERMFKRGDGAQVIVATPTLAQGLNLPAQLAILASDMRADTEDGGREALQAHEILNAAARAGRAGHLANGVVLLVPEAVLTFTRGKPLDGGIVERLQSVLPEDDRCIDITDPLQLILDKISADGMDADVEYALNRMSTALTPEEAETAAKIRFPVQKSFAAFAASQSGTVKQFNTQIEKLNGLLNSRNSETEDQLLLELAAQSGAPISALRSLKDRLHASTDKMPKTIPEWVEWTFEWLATDDRSRAALLGRERRAILGAVGRKVDDPLTSEPMRELQVGVDAWISGKPICEIEQALGGDPNKVVACPRARRLVSNIIPLGVSFIFGLIVRSASDIEGIADGTLSPRSVTECLATAIRRGFDSPSKLAFAEVRKGLLTRVQYHRAFTEVENALNDDSDDDFASLVTKIRGLLALLES